MPHAEPARGCHLQSKDANGDKVAMQSRLSDMSFMFGVASSFHASIGDWDTSKVTNMAYMFSVATSFSHIIGSWNTTCFTSMEVMFGKAHAFRLTLTDGMYLAS
jgi:surface protein